tara:strand:- start:401 stop:850 length:450 start_codon:yes stop_codon:yes gene_type:complete
MNSFKYLLAILYVSFSFSTYGQNLEETINSFEAPSIWTLTFDSTYQGENEEEQFGVLPVAKWTITSGKAKLEYLIFDESTFDYETFQKKVNEYYAVSSCSSSANSNYPFYNFSKDGFFFLKPICSDCHADKHPKCKKLSKRFGNWLRKK